MTDNLRKLIQILSDGNFHSGAELGQILGMTRASIWKHIQQFSELEIEVESKTNKGYRIEGGLELLDLKIIKRFMGSHPKNVIDHIEVFDSLTSTNDYLMQIANTHSGKVQACFAELQTAGKGRLGRQWLSPYARNIYLSVLWNFSNDLSQLSGLSLVIAIAIYEALKLYGVKNGIELKWPNDVYWQNQKLAGVLIEICAETNNFCSAVIGVGLNVAMPKASLKKIKRPCVDVAQIINEKPQRNRLAGLLLNQLCVALTIFQDQGLRPFVKKWHELDMTKGKKITVLSRTKKIQGISQGIDKNGCFLLENHRGEIKSFSSGEVSLRI